MDIVDARVTVRVFYSALFLEYSPARIVASEMAGADRRHHRPGLVEATAPWLHQRCGAIRRHPSGSAFALELAVESGAMPSTSPARSSIDHGTGASSWRLIHRTFEEFALGCSDSMSKSELLGIGSDYRWFAGSGEQLRMNSSLSHDPAQRGSLNCSAAANAAAQVSILLSAATGIPDLVIEVEGGLLFGLHPGEQAGAGRAMASWPTRRRRRADWSRRCRFPRPGGRPLAALSIGRAISCPRRESWTVRTGRCGVVIGDLPHAGLGLFGLGGRGAGAARPWRPCRRMGQAAAEAALLILALNWSECL